MTSNRVWKYDVFISFRGKDTRDKFTDHLYQAFRRVGINAFRDNEELRTGEEIASSLLRVIEESRTSIVVFSKNYASSAWCLDELVKILECKKKKRQMVLPIFYEVDPSDVRHQKGSFGNAMKVHEERFKNHIDKVQKWRSTLHKAANISGECYRNGSETEFIQTIVTRLLGFSDHLPLHITENPVGLKSRTLQVVSLLGNGSHPEHDVHMIGIYGIGGIGKTTIAKAVHNMVACQFESTCFVADVREVSTKHGLVDIQKAILTDIFGQEDIKLSNIHKGTQIMKERLHNKKILLILDDVDNLQQLHSLAGGTDWFGSGSRVIITTRDKHLLERHCGERMYEVKELDDKEALELFCWNAFGRSAPPEGFVYISADMINYAQGIPLALEVIGSDMFGKDIDEWECTLDKYKSVMNNNIFSVLQISYEKLEYNEKEIFLDIACFFKGVRWDYGEKILEGCDFSAKSGLGVLEDKCFIKRQKNCIWVHDIIQCFGREIVRLESEREPGNRSRIWFHKDALQVLTRDTGTSKIQGLMLEMPQGKEVPWSGKSFKKMVNLRILIIRKAIFLKAPKHLPNSLRVLEWEEYPSSSLPDNFHGNELLDLGMPRSNHAINLKQLFMKFQNVTSINFQRCRWLVEVPDLSSLTNLKELSLDYCENLVKVDYSLRVLQKLEYLTIVNCHNLKAFPILDGFKALRKQVSTGIYIERDIERQLLQGMIEAKSRYIIIDGVRIPSYCDYRFNVDSFSFWIHEKVPIIAVYFAVRKNWARNLYCSIYLSIGSLKKCHKEVVTNEAYDIWTLTLAQVLTAEDCHNIEEDIKRNGRLPVEITITPENYAFERTCKDQHPTIAVEECGVYVYDRCNEHLSFTDPYNQNQIDNKRFAAGSTNNDITLSIRNLTRLRRCSV